MTGFCLFRWRQKPSNTEERHLSVLWVCQGRAGIQPPTLQGVAETLFIKAITLKCPWSGSVFLEGKVYLFVNEDLRPSGREDVSKHSKSYWELLV